MSDFQESLKVCQTEITGFLDTLFTQQLNVPEHLLEAMRYGTLLGGKRLRPYLHLTIADCLNVSRDQSLYVAGVIELVHCYSLIHDDLPAMDNAKMRRGKPSVFCQFGEATALLAGNSLLTLAFQVLTQAPIPSAQKELLLLNLCRAIGGSGMMGGQCLDLEQEHSTQSLTYSQIARVQELKTGCLIEYSCIAAGILAGVGKEIQKHIELFAKDLGLAYQITDDLLDICGQSEVVGKPVGVDDTAGKINFVSLLGHQSARHKSQELIQSAEEHLIQAELAPQCLLELLQFILNRTH